MPNFPKNEQFLPPYMHTYVHVCVSGGKKCSFFGKFGLLCFLETPVLRFVLSPHYQRISEITNIHKYLIKKRDTKYIWVNKKNVFWIINWHCMCHSSYKMRQPIINLHPNEYTQ